MKVRSWLLPLMIFFVDIENRLLSCSAKVKRQEQQHPEAHSVSSIAEEPAAPRKRLRIAVCFVGQFLRGASGKKEVAGFRQRFAAGFGEYAVYDAFVATSTQHFEERPDGPQVNASALCSNLQSPIGPFDSCEVSTIPYGSGAQFLAATSGLPFRISNGLYPHRLASYFSSISQCLEQVHRADILSKHSNYTRRRLKSISKHKKSVLSKQHGGSETSTNVNHSKVLEPLSSSPMLESTLSTKPPPQSSASSMYDAIVVTRLELIGLVTLRSSLDELLQGIYVSRRKSGRRGEKKHIKITKWEWEHSVVAARDTMRRCEDRFFLGPPQLMLPLRFLSSNIAYLFAPFLGDFNTTMLTSRRSDNHRRRLDNIDGAMSIRGGSNDGVRKINDEGSINTSNINCSTHENSSGSGDASDSAKMNAGRTVDEDASDRASVLALLKPAKLFCPETLLYEYLSAIAASQEATILSSSTFATISSRFSPWKRKYDSTFGSNLAHQLHVSEDSFDRRS